MSEVKSVHIEKQGHVFDATIATKEGKNESRSFESLEEAISWTTQATYEDTPELAASEMSVEDAERINSNVNHPPTYPGADSQTSGAEQDKSNDQTQTHAPHEMGDTAANDDKPVKAEEETGKKNTGK